MPNVLLHVNGMRYGGWESVSITRGIESIAGGFDLSITERWGGQDEPWAISEEDECTVSIDGVVVITGYVDKRTHSYGAEEHTVRVSGRDKTGMLVDCSAVLTDRWEFTNTPALNVAKLLAGAHGITVALQSGLQMPAPPIRQAVNPGDSAFDVIDRACRLAGVLPVSDGAGGLLLTRAGTSRATTALVEGENIKSAEAAYDASQRFHTYMVAGQFPGSDEYFGSAAAAVEATAVDSNVRRATRTLMVRPEGNTTLEYAQERANWEAIVRAARAGSVSVTVQGWHQNDGSLWLPNTLVPLRSPFLGIDADMLITQVVHGLDDTSGTTTKISLKPPNAFLPEPVIPEGTDVWDIADD